MKERGKMRKHNFKSELKGIVGLVKDFKSEALLPLFEAVVNSIHAIADAGKTAEGIITVVINRAKPVPEQANLFDGGEARKEPEIESFEIIDNGIGFTEDNLNSFETIGSQYKEKIGGKGVGRFTWLKAFENVHIESVYMDDACQKKKRIIDFSMNNDLNVKTEVCSDSVECGTSVTLSKFLKSYRSSPTACRTGKKIAQRITEHCLDYFIAGKCPEIVVRDVRPDNTSNDIKLSDMFSQIKENMTDGEIDIKGVKFTLHHLKVYDTSTSVMHKAVLCADGREVETIDLRKEIGASTQFDSDDKRFTYALYAGGDYLNKHVSTNRQEFDLSDEDLPLTPGSEVGMQTIKTALISAAKMFLAPQLEKLDARRREILEEYVANKNPAMRPVLRMCPDVVKEIDPNTSEEKIEEMLCCYRGKAEYALRKQTAKLLRKTSGDMDKVAEEVKEISAKLTDAQKGSLANYVLLRKLVIEMLAKKIEMTKDGKFAREDVIHDIFMPKKTTSDTVSVEDHNLWLLDDRLTFHHFAASDKPLSQTMTTDNADRPDIVVFSDVDDDTREVRSVAIVEFKRPEREEYDEPITAQVKRMQKGIMTAGKCPQANGRPLVVNDSTRYYAYCVCDITDKVKDAAEDNDFVKLPGNLGYFKYYANLKLSTYIINYDMIVTDARKRHKAFFEKLGV